MYMRKKWTKIVFSTCIFIIPLPVDMQVLKKLTATNLRRFAYGHATGLTGSNSDTIFICNLERKVKLRKINNTGLICKGIDVLSYDGTKGTFYI